MVKRLVIYGYMQDPEFQQCCEAGEYLNAMHGDTVATEAQRMLGFEYERIRDRLIDNKLLSDSDARVVIVTDDKNVELAETFLKRITRETEFRLFDCHADDAKSYLSLAQKNYSLFLKATGCMFAWMVVKIGDMVQGRVVFQLFSSLVPRTCQNFVHLCRGDLPDTQDADGNRVRLHYKGTNFYRTVPNGWIQGGDVSGKGGNGGYSAFGRYFPDESFAVRHNEIGVVGMVNDGEHTNASSFYITLAKSSWMDSRYVAFGRVVEGLSVVHAIAAIETKHNQSPKTAITISDCGEM